MSIRKFSWKVEFQARGAGHIHGVCWVDLKKVSESLEFHQDSESVDERMDADEPAENIGKDKTVLEQAFKALRENIELSIKEEDALAKFVDMISTCSLNP